MLFVFKEQRFQNMSIQQLQNWEIKLHCFCLQIRWLSDKVCFLITRRGVTQGNALFGRFWEQAFRPTVIYIKHNIQSLFYLIRYLSHIYTQHTDPHFVGSILTPRWGVCLRVISCLCWPLVLVVFLVNVPARLGGWRSFDDFCWGWKGPIPQTGMFKNQKRLQPLPVGRISESTVTFLISSWNRLGSIGTGNIYSAIICNFKKHH